jgi:hypothetical protein
VGDPFALLGALVLEDGRRWGDAAVPCQLQDARAVLDERSPTPFHFLTRARGYSKTSDDAGMNVAVMLEQLPPGARLYAVAADRDQGALIVESSRRRSLNSQSSGRSRQAAPGPWLPSRFVLIGRCRYPAVNPCYQAVPNQRRQAAVERVSRRPADGSPPPALKLREQLIPRPGDRSFSEHDQDCLSERRRGCERELAPFLG